MKNLEFKIAIAAPKKKVWDIMLNPETYKHWVEAAWPGSFYEGKWDEGAEIRFIGDDGSGTLALITDNRNYEYLSMRHIAILQAGGVEDRDSEMAKGWIGITESYSFTGTNGETLLTVTLMVPPPTEEMFNNGWPKALDKLKEICEVDNQRQG